MSPFTDALKQRQEELLREDLAIAEDYEKEATRLRKRAKQLAENARLIRERVAQHEREYGLKA